MQPLAKASKETILLVKKAFPKAPIERAKLVTHTGVPATSMPHVSIHTPPTYDVLDKVKAQPYLEKLTPKEKAQLWTKKGLRNLMLNAELSAKETWKMVEGKLIREFKFIPSQKLPIPHVTPRPIANEAPPLGAFEAMAKNL